MTEYEKGYAQALKDVWEAYSTAAPQGHNEVFQTGILTRGLQRLQANVDAWEGHG